MLADDKIVGILTSTDLSAVLEVVLQTSHAAALAQPDAAYIDNEA